jgi:hypothetical protein
MFKSVSSLKTLYCLYRITVFSSTAARFKVISLLPPNLTVSSNALKMGDIWCSLTGVLQRSSQ